MMKHLGVPTSRLSTVLLLLVLLFGQAGVVSAFPVPWEGPNNGNWNDDLNWLGDIQPRGFADEAALINNNTTALLAAPSDHTVAGLRLGVAAADIGGLQINNGGSLTSEFVGGENGTIQVGIAGTGNLTINGGGSLTGNVGLSLGGGVNSSITLGDNSGLVATLSSLTNTTLGRTTRINGPNVNFTTTQNLTLSGTSILVGDIRNATQHGKLTVNGTANLNGTFRPIFTGVTPTVTSKWTLVDAANINGSFSTLDVSQAPALTGALAYTLVRDDVTVPGRKLVNLAVEQLLTLNVNRTTGATSIQNTGTVAHQIDGYSILSTHGSLTGSWTSLQDSAVPGWVEAAPVASDLSELNPQGSSTVNAGTSLPGLGTPYQAKFPAFGVDPDDITFEYTLTNGRIVEGFVNYTGTKINNDLVVNINKTTGQAAIRNDSPFSVQIDGYAVYSPSGALVPGTWNSLADQGVTGWQEALPTANVVSELRASGALTLTPGSGFVLGGLYTPGGSVEDLRLEFLMPGQENPENGVIVYGAFVNPPPPAAGVPGDYNNNNVVDAADYVVWRNSVGQNIVLPNNPIPGIIGAAHYNQWKANFGKTPGAGSDVLLAGVPEPTSVFLVLSAVVAMAAASRGLIGRARDLR